MGEFDFYDLDELKKIVRFDFEEFFDTCFYFNQHKSQKHWFILNGVDKLKYFYKKKILWMFSRNY